MLSLEFVSAEEKLKYSALSVPETDKLKAGISRLNSNGMARN